MNFVSPEVKKMMDQYINEEIRPRADKGYLESLAYDPNEEVIKDLEYNNATSDLEYKGDYSDEFDDEAL